MWPYLPVTITLQLLSNGAVREILFEKNHLIYLPTTAVNAFAAVLHSELEVILSQVKSWNTGRGNIHRKCEPKPLSTLFLSTIRVSAVAGCVHATQG